jgi:RNA polymerase sigma-70 factor, ECF subfamily
MFAQPTNAMTDSDEHLILLWKTLADETALSCLASRYLPQFYRTARAMMLSHVQAEDIAQEVMLRVIRALPTFVGDSGFRVWSYKVLLNTIRTEAHRSKRRNHASIDANGGAMPADSNLAEPIAHTIRSELHSAFEGALGKLTDAQRTALVLMHIDGLPAHEIASLLDCSVDAIYQRIAEAKTKLRTDVKLRSLWTDTI